MALAGKMNDEPEVVGHYAAAVYDPTRECGLPVIEALGSTMTRG